MKTEALLFLSMEVGGLSLLSDWPPVGSLLIELATAMDSGGGLSQREIRRLRLWARRWRVFPPHLQAFYAEHCSHACVGSSLWSILEQGDEPSRILRGMMSRLYEENKGTSPPFRLTPPCMVTRK